MYGVPERRLPDCKHSSYFLRYANNITSQGGEDGIIDKIFECIGTSADSNPYCVEIGAWDGKHLSNTYNLIHENKWSGLLIEADMERYQSLTSLYSDRADVLCLNCLVDVEGDNSLSSIFIKNNIQLEIDFLSIDIDGADYHIWSSFNDSQPYHPRVVCIEFNPSIQNHVYYVQEKDISVQEGSSLLAISELGYQLGYQIVATTTFNAIFIRYDLLKYLPKDIFTYQYPNDDTTRNIAVDIKSLEITATNDHIHYKNCCKIDLNSLHVGSMITDLFQTYSGELKLCGPKKLLWHRIPMNIQQMQAIKAKKDRIFPFAPQYNKLITMLEEIQMKITSLINDLLVDIRRKGCNDAIIAISDNNSTTSSGISIEQIIVDVKSFVLQLIEQCNEIFGISTSLYHEQTNYNNNNNNKNNNNNNNNNNNEKRPLQGICTDVLLHIVMVLITSFKELSLFNNNSNSSNNNDNSNNSFRSMIDELFRDSLTSFSFCMENIGDKKFELHKNGAFYSKKDNLLNSNNSSTIQFIISDAKTWYQRSRSVCYLATVNHSVIYNYPTNNDTELYYAGNENQTTVTSSSIAAIVMNRLNHHQCDNLTRLDGKISHCYLLLVNGTAVKDPEIQHRSAEDLDNICQGLYWFHIAAQQQQLQFLHDSNQISTNVSPSSSNNRTNNHNSMDKLGIKWLAKLLPNSIYTNKMIKEKLKSKHSSSLIIAAPTTTSSKITNTDNIALDNICSTNSSTNNYYSSTADDDTNSIVNHYNHNSISTSSTVSFYSGFLLGFGVALTCVLTTYTAYSKDFKTNK